MCLARFEAAFWRKERPLRANRWTKESLAMSVRAGNLPGLRTQAQSKTMKAIAIGECLRQMQHHATYRGKPPERRVSGSVDAELKLVPARTPCEPRKRSSYNQYVGRGSPSNTRIELAQKLCTGASNFLAVVQFLNAIFPGRALAVDLLVEPSGTLFHVVTTKRGLSFGSRGLGCQ